MAELKPPYVHTAPDTDHHVFAIRSLIAGLISMVAWLLPNLACWHGCCRYSELRSR